jgi:hypothetical protein
MTFDTSLLAISAFAAFVYLLIALLRPEAM